MSNYIDVHYHLDLQKDMLSKIKYFEEHKIYVIAVTNHPKVFSHMIKQVSSPYVRMSLGFHPEVNVSFDFELFQKHIGETIYIGEVGLDFSNKTMDDIQRATQIDNFVRIISTCNKKIISIHSRKAEKEVIEIIKNNNKNQSKYILHWYSGNNKNLQDAINQGFYFSANCAMLKSIRGREIIKQITLEQILIETDSPFIEKYCLQEAYIELSKLMDIPNNDMINIIYNNFRRILYEIRASKVID